jgi:short-subunit dehydrogenase
MTQVKKVGTALVTGASSGIGLELVKLFARDGYHLVLVARGADKLREIGKDLEMRTGAVVTVVGADLSDPGVPPEILRRLEQEGIEVDVLVNNAGYGSYGLFAETDVVRELAMIQVNVAAPTHLTKMFLPGMLRRRRGAILNVASTAAFQPGPLMAVYYATKAYCCRSPRPSPGSRHRRAVRPCVRAGEASRRARRWRTRAWCESRGSWTPPAWPAPATTACAAARPW